MALESKDDCSEKEENMEDMNKTLPVVSPDTATELFGKAHDKEQVNELCQTGNDNR